MFGKLKKFIEDRRGVSGLGKLLMILAMVGIAVGIGLYLKGKIQTTADTETTETLSLVQQINPQQ